MGMALTFATVGQKYTVTGLRAPEKLKRHLSDLGITVGSEISTVSDAGGDVILRLKDGRVAMNKSLAMKIEVAPVA